MKVPSKKEQQCIYRNGDNETKVRIERKETKKKSYQVEKSMNSIECQDQYERKKQSTERKE